MNIIEKEVVVIGAGLTGLTVSYYLNKKNIDFITIDNANEVGGVIKTNKEQGFLFEQGPNTGVIGNTAVVELFNELSDECCLEVANENVKKRYILKNSEWNHLPLGFKDAIKTPLFTFKDKIKVLGEPFRKAGSDPHENLADFVKRRLGDSFLKYAIDPFILGVYAGDPNYLIPKYALPKLYNLEQKYGSLIWGSVRKKFEPKTGLEKQVTKSVFSFKGGMSSLINALYKKSNSNNFILSANNIIIKKTDSGYSVEYIDKDNNLNIIKTKKVITTIGAYNLNKLLPFIKKEKIEKINNLLYTKVIEVTLGFNKWNGIKLDGFGGLIPSVEKRDILGFLFMSSLFENRCQKEGALITIFMGGTKRQDLIEFDDEQIEKIVENESKKLLKLTEFKPDLFKIVRHNYAIPQYGIDSGVRFETINEIELENDGLFIGGNLCNGIGMADRIMQGKTLSEKALKI